MNIGISWCKILKVTNYKLTYIVVAMQDFRYYVMRRVEIMDSIGNHQALLVYDPKICTEPIKASLEHIC